MMYKDINNHFKVFECPEGLITKKKKHIFCFLAGGIVGCPNWQKEIIEIFNNLTQNTGNLFFFNPRRENFPIHDSNASNEQITWEFKYLEQMDIFSMYFCNSDSDQPICMYELGRNIVKMQQRFPYDWPKRIIITIEEGYKRQADVEIQTKLATNGMVIPFVIKEHEKAIGHHACEIYKSYLILSK